MLFPQIVSVSKLMPCSCPSTMPTQRVHVWPSHNKVLGVHAGETHGKDRTQRTESPLGISWKALTEGLELGGGGPLRGEDWAQHGSEPFKCPFEVGRGLRPSPIRASGWWGGPGLGAVAPSPGQACIPHLVKHYRLGCMGYLAGGSF